MVSTGVLREEAITIVDLEASLVDFDTDADGIADTWEKHWFGNLTTANATTDNDGDGLTDYQEYKLRIYGYAPNNKYTFSADQTDKEYDCDADGIADWWEYTHFGNLTSATATTDSDEDGLIDYYESLVGGDPKDKYSIADDGVTLDSECDTDKDDLIDKWELDFFGNLDAQSGDSDADGDGLNNYWEMKMGWNPTTPVTTVRSFYAVLDDDTYALVKQTGTTFDPANLKDDAAEVAALKDGAVDYDGDGLANYDEVAGTLPFQTDPMKADSDGDGWDDYKEIFETLTDPLVANVSSDIAYPRVLDLILAEHKVDTIDPATGIVTEDGKTILDRTAPYVQFNDCLEIADGQKFTVAMWFKLDAASGNTGALLQKDIDSPVYGDIQDWKVYLDNGALTVDYATVGTKAGTTGVETKTVALKNVEFTSADGWTYIAVAFEQKTTGTSYTHEISFAYEKKGVENTEGVIEGAAEFKTVTESHNGLLRPASGSKSVRGHLVVGDETGTLSMLADQVSVWKGVHLESEDRAKAAAGDDFCQSFDDELDPVLVTAYDDACTVFDSESYDEKAVTDTDNDGIADWWEIKWSCDIENVPNGGLTTFGANSDYDKDGLNDYEEYLLYAYGVSPRNKYSIDKENEKAMDGEADLDDDELPTWYEWLFFAGDESTQTASDDSDIHEGVATPDGLTNAEEFELYEIGADPMDPYSLEKKYSPEKYEAGELILDGDYQIDTDEDGIADWWEYKYFGDLTSTDGTGDADADGLTDKQEYDLRANGYTPIDKSSMDRAANPGKAEEDLVSDYDYDSDADTIGDWWEYTFFTNLTTADGTDTSDQDGELLIDLDEYLVYKWGYKPDDKFSKDRLDNPTKLAAELVDDYNYDSDADGMPDWWEYKTFGNLDGDITADTDGDGIYDAWEFIYFGDLTIADETTDFEPDGLSDLYEFLLRTIGANPKDEYSLDKKFNPKKYLDPTDPEYDPTAKVLDGDFYVDIIDEDGDGISDIWEYKNFGDLTTADETTDYDGDSLLDIYEAKMGYDPKAKYSTKRSFYALLDDDSYVSVIQDGSTFTPSNLKEDAVKVAALTDGEVDFDGDGIANADELNSYGTDPFMIDTDEDGYHDDVELFTLRTNPLDPTDPAGKPAYLDLVLAEHEIKSINYGTGEIEDGTATARTTPYVTYADQYVYEEFVPNVKADLADPTTYTYTRTEGEESTSVVVSENDMLKATVNNGFEKFTTAEGDAYRRAVEGFSGLTDPQHFAISLWFQLDEASDLTGDLLAKQSVKSDGFKFFQDFRLYLDNGVLKLDYNTVGTTTTTAGNAVQTAELAGMTFAADGEWHHVIAALSQNDTSKGQYTYSVVFAYQKDTESAEMTVQQRTLTGLLRPAPSTSSTWMTQSLDGRIVIGADDTATDRLSVCMDQIAIWKFSSTDQAFFSETRTGEDAADETDADLFFFANCNQPALAGMSVWSQGKLLDAVGEFENDAFTALDIEEIEIEEDSDNDGIADAWELYYFGDLTTTGKPYEKYDYDKDGVTDYQEYKMGYDPTNKVSVPRSYYATVGDEYILVTQQTDGTFVKYGTTETVVPEDADELKLLEDGEVDYDGDYLSNADENDEYGSDPLKGDTDWDGLDDWEEAMLDTDPEDGLDPWRNRVLDLIAAEHEVTILTYDENTNTVKESTENMAARTAPYAVVEDFNDMIKDLSAWSAEFWFNLAEVADGVILQKTADVGKQDFKLELVGGNFALTLNDTLSKTKVRQVKFEDFTVEADKWMHFAFSVKQTADKEYKVFMMGFDGENEFATAEDDKAFTFVGKLRTAEKAGDLVIGDPDGKLSVQIDELRIWNKVVSQEDFAANRNFMLDDDTTGMAVYFKFNTKTLSGDTVSAVTYASRSDLAEDVERAQTRLSSALTRYQTAYDAVYDEDGTAKSDATDEQKTELANADSALKAAQNDYKDALAAYNDEVNGDGLVAVLKNDAELSIITPKEYLDGDSDEDQIADWWEMMYFGDLTTADDDSDYDEDGLTDLYEYLLFNDGADPTDPYSLDGVNLDGDVDSDGDDLPNSGEVTYKTDPTERDTDSDDFTDWEEAMLDTDPLDNSDPWFNRSLDLIAAEHDVKAYKYDETAEKIVEDSDVTMVARIAPYPYAVIEDFNDMIKNLSSWSAELWFKLDDASGVDGALLQKTADKTNAKADFWFGLADGGKLTLEINDTLVADAGKKRSVALDGFTATTGAWIHVAFAVNKTDTNKYTVLMMAYNADTEEQIADEQEFTGAIVTDSQDGDLEIGDKTGALSLQIDELRIWNKVVSMDDFALDRDVFLPAETAKLAAYYQFNYTISTGEGVAAITYAARSDLSEKLATASDQKSYAEEWYETAYNAVYDEDGEERSGATDEQKEELENATSYRTWARSNYYDILDEYTKEMATDGLVAKFMPAEPNAAYLSITDSEEYQGGDSDNDGIADWWELTYFGNTDTATATSDNDGDNLSDYYEYLLREQGADPTDPYSLAGDGKTLDGDVDSDNDGLTNAEELNYDTDPLSKDTDDDGISDKIEVALCANPTHPMSVVVTKADGEPLTGKTWADIKDTDLTLYRSTNAPSRSLDLGALADKIELPEPDRFAVGTRQSNSFNDTLKGDFTVELWVKATAGTESVVLFETKAADTDFGWRLQLVDGVPEGEIFTMASGTEQVLAIVGGKGATPALQADTWTYLALNWDCDAKTLNLFRDKIALIGSLPITYAIDFGSESEYAFIGNASGVAIDEFRFWGETRSAEQIEYWAEKIIPSPLNAIVTYERVSDGEGGTTEERHMARDYELRANYRFDDGGESIEDFAHFQEEGYALENIGSAIIGLDNGAKDIGGIDDVDGDGIPEWWVNIWNLNTFPNATKNKPSVGWYYVPGHNRGRYNSSDENYTGESDWQDMLVWEDDSIVGLYGYQYGVAYNSLGGTAMYSANWKNGELVSVSNYSYEYGEVGGYEDGGYICDNQQLGLDMAYVTMHKYFNLATTPSEAYLSIETHIGASITGVVINQNKLESWSSNVNVAEYLHSGRNQIVVVWSRSATAHPIEYEIPHGDSTVTYDRNVYTGSVDVGLTVDENLVIAKGHYYRYDPRAVWYFRATTQDYGIDAMSGSWGDRGTDANGYLLNYTIVSTDMDPYAYNYGAKLDKDEDGLDLYSEYLIGTNPSSKECDNNGIEDGEEDYDEDGIVNNIEINTLFTDALCSDTDNDGTKDATEQASGSDPADWNSPENNFSLLTDGTDDCYLEMPLQSRFALENFTIEATVYPTAFDKDAIVIQRVVGTVDEANPLVNYELGIQKGGKPYFKFTDKDGDATGRKLVAPAVIKTEEWTHLAAIYDVASNTMSLYVNGKLSVSKSAASQPVTSGPALVYTRAGKNFVGQIDELRFWNDVRTAEELQANQENSLEGSEDGLVAYYRFDDADLEGREEILGGTTDPKYYYCADSFVGSACDWRNEWANVARLCGTAKTVVDPDYDETDSDGDGIADEWELYWFGDLVTANDTSDYDGDGVSDLNEFRMWKDSALGYPAFDPTSDVSTLRAFYTYDKDGNYVRVKVDGSTITAFDGTAIEVEDEEFCKNASDGEVDYDGDGLDNAWEGGAFGSDPVLVDSDADGLDDFEEGKLGSDPMDGNSPWRNKALDLIKKGHTTLAFDYDEDNDILDVVEGSEEIAIRTKPYALVEDFNGVVTSLAKWSAEFWFRLADDSALTGTLLQKTAEQKNVNGDFSFGLKNGKPVLVINDKQSKSKTNSFTYEDFTAETDVWTHVAFSVEQTTASKYVVKMYAFTAEQKDDEGDITRYAKEYKTFEKEVSGIINTTSADGDLVIGDKSGALSVEIDELRIWNNATGRINGSVGPTPTGNNPTSITVNDLEGFDITSYLGTYNLVLEGDNAGYYVQENETHRFKLELSPSTEICSSSYSNFLEKYPYASEMENLSGTTGTERDDFILCTANDMGTAEVLGTKHTIHDDGTADWATLTLGYANGSGSQNGTTVETEGFVANRDLFLTSTENEMAAYFQFDQTVLVDHKEFGEIRAVPDMNAESELVALLMDATIDTPAAIVSIVDSDEYMVGDSDDDDIRDWWEFANFNGVETAGQATDSDGDGLNDYYEYLLRNAEPYAADPNNKWSLKRDGKTLDSRVDSDGDGMTNADEQLAGTNPARKDTDGDNVSDRDEREYGSDPLDPSDPWFNRALDLVLKDHEIVEYKYDAASSELVRVKPADKTGVRTTPHAVVEDFNGVVSDLSQWGFEFWFRLDDASSLTGTFLQKTSDEDNLPDFEFGLVNGVPTLKVNDKLYGAADLRRITLKDEDDDTEDFVAKKGVWTHLAVDIAQTSNNEFAVRMVAFADNHEYDVCVIEETGILNTVSEDGDLVIGDKTGALSLEMDELRFWNAIRTVEEIGAARDVQIDASNSDLAAYFQFNSKNVGSKTVSAVMPAGMVAKLEDDAIVNIVDASNYLEGDSDNDGIADYWEYENFSDLSTADSDSDFDEDGLPDYYEYLQDADPKDQFSLDDDDEIMDGDYDYDGDGLTSREELDNGINPMKVDTDDDGIGDKIEWMLHSSPVHPMSVVVDANGKQLTTADTWQTVQANQSNYTAAIAEARSLELKNRIDLPKADRFAVGAYVEEYNKTYSGDFTLEMWVKAKAGNENAVLFETTAEDSDYGWTFQLKDGVPYGKLFKKSETIAEIGGKQFAPALEAGVWTHLALNWNSGTKSLVLYRDKLAVLSVTATAEGIDLGSEVKEAYIGAADGVTIDEFRFWTETRSAEQIEYWADKIVPAPLNCIISYEELPGEDGDTIDVRYMEHEYALAAYYRFDDAGDTIEDFANFQKDDYALDAVANTTADDAKELRGTDDVDGDGVPEWWINVWKLNGFPNASENEPSTGWLNVPGHQYTYNGTSDWRDMLKWNKDNGIEGLYGYQYGVTYTCLGGSSIYTTEWTNGEIADVTVSRQGYRGEVGNFAEGTYIVDNNMLSVDMAYVTMHKYVNLIKAPEEAYITTGTHFSASITGVIVNGTVVTLSSTGEEGESKSENIAQYLTEGRNQIVVVWARSVIGTYTFEIPHGDTTVSYSRSYYNGAVDVDMTVDGELVIARGHDYRYDPRAAWYFRATTKDYSMSSMEAYFCNRSTDDNGYALNLSIVGTTLSKYAYNYATVLDADGDNLSLYYEYLLGTNPKNSDSDGNGITDTQEDCDKDGIANAFEINTLLTDALCADTDNDGVSDSRERSLGTDPTDWNSPTSYLFLTLDGTDGCYAQLPMQRRFALDTFTLEAMVNPDKENLTGMIIQRVVGTVDSENPLVNYELGLSNGKPYFLFTDNSGSKSRHVLSASQAVEVGTDDEPVWTHLAVSYDAATSQMMLYVNGQRMASANAPTPPVTVGPGLVYTRVGEGFIGGIDDVRIWNDVRTADEIKANMDVAQAYDAENLVANYRFDDVSDKRSSTDEFAKCCADSVFDSLYDWRNYWENAAVLCGTAKSSVDTEYDNEFEVAIYAYSTGIEEGKEDPEYAYLAAAGSGLEDDILQAVIVNYPAVAETDTMNYKYFWLKNTSYDSEVLVDQLSYASGVLYDVATGSSLDDDVVLGNAYELDLAQLDDKVAVGDTIQLVVAATCSDESTSYLSVSDSIELAVADVNHSIPTALVLVDPVKDVTGLKANTALNVKVKNVNNFAGKAHITWYRNMVPAKTDAVDIAANATVTISMVDTKEVVEGDVWSFKIWFGRDGEGVMTRSRTITPAKTLDPKVTTADWIYMMIGEGYDEDAEGSGKTEYGAPTKPTTCYITPVNPDPQSILTVTASGSTCSYPFNYYYQWYYKATTSSSYVLATGQDLPYWQPAVTDISDDMGTTEAGFTTYVLDAGDQVYCSVYAMNIYGEKSASVIANNANGTRVTIAADVTSDYYEPNDDYEHAYPIYAKTTWMDTSDANIQMHNFKDRNDQDWVWFVVPASTDNRQMLVSFETNAGTMFHSGVVLKDASPDTQFSLYKKGANGKPTHIKSFTQYSANDETGSFTGFARFENMVLEPGTYFIQVSLQNRDASVGSAPYYMHLYMEYEPWTGETYTWDEVKAGEAVVELTPEEPSGSDNLKVKMNAYAYDNNNEKVLDYRYLWYRNGIVVPLAGPSTVEDYTTSQYLLDQAVSSYDYNGKTISGDTIVADMTEEGDVWYCEVYPYTDELGWGEGVVTNTVAIGTCKWNMTLTTRKSFFNDPETPSEEPKEEDEEADTDDETEEDETRGSVNPGDEVVVLGWDEFATFGYDLSYDSAFPNLTIPNGDGTYSRQALEHGCLYSLGLTNDHPYLSKDYRPYGKTGTWFVVAEMGDPKEDTITEFALCWDAVNMPNSNASNITITQMSKRVDGYYETILGTTITVVPGEAGEIVLDSSKLNNLQLDENGQKYAIFRITIGSPDAMQELALVSGWNLIALPMTPLYTDVNDVFSVNGSKIYSGSVWKYEGGRYVAAENIVATKGYWLYAKTPVTLQVYGTDEADTISLSEGWNIIGPVVDIDDFVGTYKTLYPTVYEKIEKNEQGDPELYEFVDGKYGLATDASGKYVLKVGKGYWIKAKETIELPVVK